MESYREYLSSRTKGDECAFAIPAFETPKNLWNKPQYGLTKREYFAAMAMQGYLASNRTDLTKPLATYSVEKADQLIEALNNEI